MFELSYLETRTKKGNYSDMYFFFFITDMEGGKTDSTHLPAAKEYLLHDGHRRRSLHVGILTRREGRGEDASRMTTRAPYPALSSQLSLACLPEAPWRRVF